jgi:hypothetical protein
VVSAAMGRSALGAAPAGRKPPAVAVGSRRPVWKVHASSRNQT